MKVNMNKQILAVKITTRNNSKKLRNPSVPELQRMKKTKIAQQAKRTKRKRSKRTDM